MKKSKEYIVLPLKSVDEDASNHVKFADMAFLLVVRGD